MGVVGWGMGLLGVVAAVLLVGGVGGADVLEIDRMTSGVRREGSRLCVVGENRGAVVLDVSHPERPQMVGSVLLPRRPSQGKCIATEAGAVYVWDSEEVRAYDLRKGPQPVAAVAVKADDVALGNGRLYVVSGGVLTVLTADGLQTKGWRSSETMIKSVSMGEGRLFAAGGMGMYVYDVVSDPDRPQRTSSLDGNWGLVTVGS
eukprot:Sspe_Gene.2794::Locus_927_Transcript_1_1_Confidence_1.000_Length_647::g.2794::m.2794